VTGRRADRKLININCCLTDSVWAMQAVAEAKGGNKPMIRRLMAVLLLVSLAGSLAACIVEPEPVGRPGYHWVRGFYGPYGGWHPGHWEPG
jgi:hypothetical protein